MAKIVIYSREICPYCVRAKNLFNKKGVKYSEIIVDDEKIRDEMIKKANGRMTVPQIFIDNKHIGGFDDLSSLDRKGELDKLLK